MRRRATLSRLLTLFLAVSLTVLPSVGFADTEKARKYYKQAVELYNQGKFEKAADLLKQAYEEEANLTYQYNRIRALEGAGDYEKALKVLKTYERPMLDANGFEDVPKIKKGLEEKVAKDTQGGSAGTPEDSLDEPRNPDKTDQAGSKKRRIISYGLLGGGAALLGTGVVFSTGMLLPSDVQQEADDSIQQYGEPRFSSEDKRNQYNRHRGVAIATIATGSAALIAGGVLLVLDSDSDSAARVTPPGDSSDPRVQIAPLVGLQGGGAMLNIDF